MFLLLESIQFATIMNLATIKDGFVPVPILMAVGWGTPAVITGKHNDYECHYDWLLFCCRYYGFVKFPPLSVLFLMLGKLWA